MPGLIISGAVFNAETSSFLFSPRLIFCAVTPRAMFVNIVDRFVRDLAQGSTGSRDWFSHSGRRSFITTLASKGIGVRVLASLAGHKSIATTQAYIDVNDDMKRAAVELVS
jgi:site-specific recombinase XerD